VPTDFTSKNAALEAKLAACNSSAELAEVLRAHQEANGLPQLYDRYAVPAGNVQAVPSAEAPKAVDDRLLRRAVTLDNGAVRLIEAYSATGLDQLENALRTGRIW